MKKKIYSYLIGILLFCTIVFSTISIAEDKEKEDVLKYELSLVILECDKVLGLPDGEHVGFLRDVEIHINGFTSGLIINIPDGNPVFIDSENNIEIIMDIFFGVTQLFSNGKVRFLE